jgi:hypothetical protein
VTWHTEKNSSKLVEKILKWTSNDLFEQIKRGLDGKHTIGMWWY